MARARSAAGCRHQRAHVARQERGLIRSATPSSESRTISFWLIITPPELRRIFGGADLREQRLHLAEAALLGHAAGVARDLLERLDIGGDPSEPMRGVLLGFERCIVELAVC